MVIDALQMELRVTRDELRGCAARLRAENDDEPLRWQRREDLLFSRRFRITPAFAASNEHRYPVARNFGASS